MANFTRGIWRVASAFRRTTIRRKVRALVLLWPFFAQWKRFRGLGGSASFSEIAPQLFDKSNESQTGGGHYFYQDVWALRHLKQLQPDEHHDVGSRLDGFVAQATAICPVIYWDIRPPQFELPNFQFRQGNILNLPLATGSIRSLSCLHVAEHIGLGRYDDPIDPAGTEKALRELQRVVVPGGQLLFSIPIGRERVEFNAQRICDPETPTRILAGMRLMEFNAVDDGGRLRQNVNPAELRNSKYACGLYRFIKN